ncbi:IS5 family transposase [Streptomyces sp. NPDC002187]|uniref:IS5 family transposase n=1 Tax=Streptomyces sp. NPDC002187 TaxID=3364637 RepID=UPI00367F0E55
MTDSERAQLEPHLPRSTGRGGRWKRHRQVINGILFRIRTGIPWRGLPRRFGSRQTCYDRHRRWSADGTWERIVRAVQAGADADGRIDWSMASVDSTVCRTHQHAAGAGSRPPSRAPAGRRPSPHPAGPSQRRQSVLVTPQPPSPAASADQAHHPRTS